MAKKTVRAAKPTQQRTKEEQWRKRMAAQARTGTTAYSAPNGAGSAVAEPEDDVETYESAAVAPAAAVPTPAPRAQAPRATSTPATAAARASAAQRRSLASQRPVRPRAGITNTMSVEEEMHYIRTDIRKLITLTAICIVIIIILAFIVPSIVK